MQTNFEEPWEQSCHEETTGYYRFHIKTSSPLEKYPGKRRHIYSITYADTSPGYSAKQHARDVAAKLEVDQGLIYLPGAPTVYLEDSDQPRPFRQRRYFYYLSGLVTCL